ncbi:MAG: hypothetical protein H6600_09465 [Flavobacteriales bacterium]|nr:hypothetical protein [Flavobacteriales bacterium]MCB9198677.1 hypothetical protein [Flavobacteriales bacterium]
MKLNYYILWVEDDDSWYTTTSELFGEIILDNGFNPQVERKKSLDDVIEELTHTGLKKYDILLIDFNLRNSKDGASIIDYLRDNQIYTDIIFYSSDKQTIVDSIKEHLFEGVYHSDRQELEDKFGKVFKTTIKKIEEINSMRGLIVGETSELDALIEEHLHFYTQSPYIDKFNIDKFITENVFQKMEDKIPFLKQKFSEEGIRGLFSQLEAIRKWELLRGILKKNQTHKTFIPEFIEKNASYQNEVIDIRNKFAHAQVIINEEGNEVLKSQIGNSHFEFDEKAFRKIREDLIKHRNALLELKK